MVCCVKYLFKKYTYIKNYRVVNISTSVSCPNVLETTVSPYCVVSPYFLTCLTSTCICVMTVTSMTLANCDVFQEFAIDPVDRYVPPDFTTKEGFYRSNPVKHSIDGSFAARLVRSLNQENPATKK